MRWIRTSFFILDPKIIFAIWPKIKNFATAILLIFLEHNRLDLHSLWNHYDWFEIDCNCFLQVSVTLVQPWPLWMTIFMPIKFQKACWAYFLLSNILRIDLLLTNMSSRTPIWVWQLFLNYQNKKGNSDIILSTWKFYCFQNAKMWLFCTNQLQSEAKIRFYLGHPLIYWP